MSELETAYKEWWTSGNISVRDDDSSSFAAGWIAALRAAEFAIDDQSAHYPDWSIEADVSAECIHAVRGLRDGE